MLLVCDIGNSNIVLGVWDGARLAASWRILSRQHATADEYIVLLAGLMARAGIGARADGPYSLQDGAQTHGPYPPDATDTDQERSMAPRSTSISASIISSVVPPLTPRLAEVLAELTGTAPLVVGPGLKTGLDIRYEDPREVGADRIVNAVAALSLYRPPLIVIDSGTATTFDVLLAPNIYAGGIIAAGLAIARDALTERTAMLPKVELRATETVLGRNTADSIRSGLFHGSGALVDGLVDKLSRELDIAPTVIAAGGMGALLAEASSAIQHVEPDLTLIGLREIWERNQG